ncbi:MAG TPA: S-layer homology domain-containing protein [Symbiobacteriaceae bacterium]|nr:S-layer homology domain-containing protein [Symbiobacteriaceae bacterium]
MHKFVTAVLAGALSLTVITPTTALARDDRSEKKRPQYEQNFKDWQQDFWANESLARMITLGVIKGNGDDTIASSRPVTRLEAAIMLSRLLELPAPEMPKGEFKIKAPWGELEIENKGDKFEIKLKTREGEFKLEDGGKIPAWGREAILIGLREGFLVFDGASVSPMKPLNRLEAAMMMVKAAGLDAEAQARKGADLPFTDADKIPERLRGYIALAVENGFVNGYEDGSFRPEQVLSRAEWAALLDRLDRKSGPAVTADGKQIKATVTAVDADATPSVRVTTPVYPGGVTYQFDPASVIYKSGKEITVADIQADDQVIINLDAEREVALLTVANVVRRVSGQVEAFTAPADVAEGSIELKEKDGTRSYKVTSASKILLSGREATFADVREGDAVTVKLEGARVSEIAIKVETKSVAGTLEAVTPGDDATLPTIALKDAEEGQAPYKVADHATIKNSNGTAITLADLQPGDQLSLKVERDLVIAIKVKVAPANATLKGALEAIDFGDDATLPTLAIKTGDGVFTYSVADHAVVKNAQGQAITLEDLNLGALLAVKVESNKIIAIQMVR